MYNQENFNERFIRTNYFALDRERPRKIAVYARVSTEHEEQINALENQIQWYDNQLENHKNWNLSNKNFYVDKGISGTQAKKRPSFLQMIEDAKSGEFDLIVTREVCRFARNVVDTLVVTRELRNYGVEVYFIQDSIWTFESDGELRLSLMATLAQEESRKISERVKAGIKVSKEKGVLYGSGNILGYERLNGTYVLNEEQAETVKMIYKLYLQGNGVMKISRILTENFRKNSSGNVKWDPTSVSRILKNETYTGKLPYNKSKNNNYLEQKRIVNLDPSTFEYKKGDFPSIVSDDDFIKVKEMMAKKTVIMKKNGTVMRRGNLPSKDFWCIRLRCNCGSRFRRDVWSNPNSKDKKTYGYQCYNHVNNGSKEKRLALGLNADGFCDLKTVPEWKLDLMANKIFEDLYLPHKNEAINIAINLIEKYFKSNTYSTKGEQEIILNKIENEKIKKHNLISLRIENELSRDEFNTAKSVIDKKIELYEFKLNELKNDEKNLKETVKLNIDEMRIHLKELFELQEGRFNRKLLGKIIVGVIPKSNEKFEFYINLNNSLDSSVLFELSGNKRKAFINLEEITEISSLHILEESFFSSSPLTACTMASCY